MANTGYKIITYKDVNVYSPTYGEVKTDKIKDDTACPNQIATWEEQSRTCEQIAYEPSGTMGNSGNAIVVQKDTNPNSSTYNEERTITVEDATTCPIPSTEATWEEQSTTCEQDA